MYAYFLLLSIYFYYFYLQATSAAATRAVNEGVVGRDAVGVSRLDECQPGDSRVDDSNGRRDHTSSEEEDEEEEGHRE
jgi:hypothetical protein